MKQREEECKSGQGKEKAGKFLQGIQSRVLWGI